ncbi:HD domain-containing protein [Hypnocyclicus thermotrophus]|uniref:HD domain-containing protein n=1 Tax=Hypnocyclicus thermotrophus TaxID=1627895 RepID=A0AA46DXU0_9FUSO|nr:HD domain-containing protein [Hypnocyclicus thermotrophus]TDT68104.1 HD domain-containing protein [Hypnocyclicus thermotrophus]
MLYKLKQVLNIIYPKIREKDYQLVIKYLEPLELNIFNEMSTYDKKHSINILKDCLKNEKLKDDILYLKLALLHDCGKDKKTKFYQRVFHSITKKGVLQFHTKRGFEKIKDINYKLALLILKHHNKNIQNEKLKIFRKIDDRN